MGLPVFGGLFFLSCLRGNEQPAMRSCLSLCFLGCLRGSERAATSISAKVSFLSCLHDILHLLLSLVQLVFFLAAYAAVDAMTLQEFRGRNF